MTKPRITVLTAAGKTGLPLALQLLSEGFPVTAFVRRADARSTRLQARGADIVTGSLTDLDDMRRAMRGATRAYFCVPIAAGYLKTASLFATVAADQKLESVVAMSQWNSHDTHPALHSRESWLADRLLAMLSDTHLTILNPGFFIDNDLQALPFAAQFGLMMLPYGQGLNAPPSNEDMARVAAAILARPDSHAGKTYRPTGPKLVSPPEIAETVARVLGHSVRYVDTPIWMFARVMKGMGIGEYQIAQYQEYVKDYQNGAFAVNAPTNVVSAITGREPEDYETVTRRYAAHVPDARRNVGTILKYAALVNVWMLSAPRTKRYLGADDFSAAKHLSLSANSADWRRDHESQPQIVSA